MEQPPRTPGRINMKRIPTTPEQNLSPLGSAVTANATAEVAADDRDLVVLSTPADESPAVQSPRANDGVAGPALQSGDNGAAAHARSVKKLPPVLAGHLTPALQTRADRVTEDDESIRESS